MIQAKIASWSAAALACACAPVVHAADAAAWPTHAVRLIVPYAPGGIADQMARIIAEGLQEALKQPFLVENKAGASGSLGTSYVAKSKPDGYTLLVGLAAPQTLNQFIYKLDYHGLNDFAPIALLNTNPLVLAVNPSLPFKTTGDVIDYARKNPGKLNFGGAGGLTQFAGEVFKYETKTEMTHVPYRGGAPAVAAAVAGDVQMTFANYSDAQPWIESGRLRAISITSAKRYPQSPSVPTIAESGVPGYSMEGWTGLLAPAGTPPEVIQKVSAVVRKTLNTPEMTRKLEAMGSPPGNLSPEEFTKFVGEEIKRWQEFVAESGIKIE
ncbi:Tripartite tricarboxylate transporter family receptor [Pigmentiphaga humi]|uniref:Tripartite tricarboxylate transporter family receptor n=1 Tax=Pigmentiphaga humi TaxID=2478468 RepID=A0A3P4B1C6_9BURK|nr:tripartite tricarboxylate transporter substrate binding protein [Pigmentiphaga humi]VCU70087.1 Tripartite tricarboxylate transporter family receptor [Pigmentiphaga humi]